MSCSDVDPVHVRIRLRTLTACDAVRSVRQELAISLSKVGAQMLRVSDAGQVEAVVAIRRADPSYRVRREVSLVDSATAC
jgi:hypothetical protein